MELGILLPVTLWVLFIVIEAFRGGERDESASRKPPDDPE